MSQPDIPPVEAGAESIKSLEMQNAPLDSAVKGQLSQPGDVQAAHNYFNGSGAELNAGNLPDLGFDSGLPADMQTGYLDMGSGGNLYSTPGVGDLAGAKVASGTESALLHNLTPTGLEGGGLMPGLEQGVLPGMAPGTEPISPMIQMILKMPGLTGTVASLFEAIMSFLFPADGGFFNLLDPTLWAQTAQQAFGSLVTAITEQIPLSITMFPNNSGFLDFFMHNGMQNGMFDSLTKTATSPDLSFSGLETAPAQTNDFLVNGGFSQAKPVFEAAPLGAGEVGGSTIQVSQGTDLLAFDNGNTFGATIGGYTPGTSAASVDPQSISTTSSTNLSNQALDGQQIDSTSSTETSGLDTTSSESSIDPSQSDPGTGTELGGDGTEIASSEGATMQEASSYMVNKGDNLWNIARDQLGSGSRWTEIYNMNTDLIGDNPNLIFSGTELQLPAADHIAQVPDYVVQPGDSLWNIAKDHLGSGNDWPQIYSGNEGLIGSNPDLIHPGQHLSMPNGSGAGSVHVAHHHVPSNGHHLSHSSASHSHHSAQPHHTAHHNSSNGTNTNATDNLAANNTGEASTGDTILKEAKSAAANAKNEIEKTANLPDNSKLAPIGLRAVAKSL